MKSMQNLRGKTYRALFEVKEILDTPVFGLCVEEVDAFFNRVHFLELRPFARGDLMF